MSLRLLTDTIEDLPYALSEQVLSYARSLESAAPEIFKDAGVKRTRVLTDKLVFYAGLRKLVSIIDSNYWIMDNAGAILERQNLQSEVRIGGADFTRGGAYHQSLIELRKELFELLNEHNALFLLRRVPYVELVQMLADER